MGALVGWCALGGAGPGRRTLVGACRDHVHQAEQVLFDGLHRRRHARAFDQERELSVPLTRSEKSAQGVRGASTRVCTGHTTGDR
jgi:hypothetical protein